MRKIFQVKGTQVHNWYTWVPSRTCGQTPRKVHKVHGCLRPVYLCTWESGVFDLLCAFFCELSDVALRQLHLALSPRWPDQFSKAPSAQGATR